MVGVLLFSNFAALPTNLNQLSSITPLSSDTLAQEDNPPTTPDPVEPNPDDNLGDDNDDIDDKTDPDPPASPFDFSSDLIIRAVNPGYTQTVDGEKLNEAGEFIELENLTGSPLALAGYSLQYDYGSSTATLFTFPEGSYMTGKHLLLSYSKSSDADKVDLTYSRSLALEAGPLVLYHDDEIVDSFCWRADTFCEGYNTRDPKDGKGTRKFNKTVAVRDLYLGTFSYLGQSDYLPDYDPALSGLYLPPEPDDEDEENTLPTEEQKLPQCRGLEFSELLTYYAADKNEQFIEFFNPTGVDIVLDGCKIGYKKKFYDLSGTVASGSYYAYYLNGQFSLTKNPKDPSLVTLIDTDGEAIDEVAYPNGQKKSTSYAKIFAADGTESWQITYAMTPGKENVYQKFRSCEEGKIINETTGNCVKVTTLKSATEKVLAPCPAGKYRNPATGRCKSIATTTSSTLKECAEGYERNPETNRCRKIKQPNDGADYSLTPTTTSANHTVFIGIGIVVMIVLLGLVYIILQFRQEIARTARKARQRLNRIRKDLLARRIGRHRNK